MIVSRTWKEEAIDAFHVKLVSSKDSEGFTDGTEYSLHVWPDSFGKFMAMSLRVVDPSSIFMLCCCPSFVRYNFCSTSFELVDYFSYYCCLGTNCCMQVSYLFPWPSVTPLPLWICVLCLHSKLLCYLTLRVFSRVYVEAEEFNDGRLMVDTSHFIGLISYR